jgi:hypothetical protein
MSLALALRKPEIERIGKIMEEKTEGYIPAQDAIANEEAVRAIQATSIAAHVNDGPSTAAARYFFSVMPRSSASILAIVDEGGDLVRVTTASDLLRVFRTLWKIEAQ